VAEAIARRALTVAALRNGAAVTRALLARASRPAAISEPPDSAPAASTDGAEDVAELLGDLLVALVELPGDGWPDLAATLPDELFDRLDRYLETLLSEGRDTRSL
jgi:hypothetical protein